MSTQSIVALIMLITSLPASASEVELEGDHVRPVSRHGLEGGLAVAEGHGGNVGRLELGHRGFAGRRIVVNEQRALALARTHRRQESRAVLEGVIRELVERDAGLGPEQAQDLGLAALEGA